MCLERVMRISCCLATDTHNTVLHCCIMVYWQGRCLKFGSFVNQVDTVYIAVIAAVAAVSVAATAESAVAGVVVTAVPVPSAAAASTASVVDYVSGASVLLLLQRLLSLWLIRPQLLCLVVVLYTLCVGNAITHFCMVCSS